MACWSAENARKAYLRALKMGKTGKEPNVAEFISALAAGNNAQLMVMACSGIAESTLLALVAAAQQTGGRVVCILSKLRELHASHQILGQYANLVELAVGDARIMLLNDYKGADFVLIDCNTNDHKGVFLAARQGANPIGTLIVGYNALHKRPRPCLSELKAYFLPIGEGLLVCRVAACGKVCDSGGAKKSHWVVKVDKFTGEEHVYRITSSKCKQISFDLSEYSP